MRYLSATFQRNIRLSWMLSMWERRVSAKIPISLVLKTRVVGEFRGCKFKNFAGTRQSSSKNSLVPPRGIHFERNLIFLMVLTPKRPEHLFWLNAHRSGSPGAALRSWNICFPQAHILCSSFCWRWRHRTVQSPVFYTSRELKKAGGLFQGGYNHRRTPCGACCNDDRGGKYDKTNNRPFIDKEIWTQPAPPSSLIGKGGRRPCENAAFSRSLRRWW